MDLKRRRQLLLWVHRRAPRPVHPAWTARVLPNALRWLRHRAGDGVGRYQCLTPWAATTPLPPLPNFTWWLSRAFPQPMPLASRLRSSRTSPTVVSSQSPVKAAHSAFTTQPTSTRDDTATLNTTAATPAGRVWETAALPARWRTRLQAMTAIPLIIPGVQRDDALITPVQVSTTGEGQQGYASWSLNHSLTQPRQSDHDRDRTTQHVGPLLPALRDRLPGETSMALPLLSSQAAPDKPIGYVPDMTQPMTRLPEGARSANPMPLRAGTLSQHNDVPQSLDQVVLAQPLLQRLPFRHLSPLARNIYLHTGREADRLTRHHRANALTIGSHIYFRQHQFDPATPRGMALLAHELVHVSQQIQDPTATALSETTVQRFEQQARAAESIVQRELHNPLPRAESSRPLPLVFHQHLSTARANTVTPANTHHTTVSGLPSSSTTSVTPLRAAEEDTASAPAAAPTSNAAPDTSEMTTDVLRHMRRRFEVDKERLGLGRF